MQCFFRSLPRHAVKGSSNASLTALRRIPQPLNTCQQCLFSNSPILPQVKSKNPHRNNDAVTSLGTDETRVEIPQRRHDAGAQHDDLDAAANPEREQWQIQKAALKQKFGDEAWRPRKRLSPDTIEGIRTMHASDPERFSTPVLAENFKVSPEAIRRILRSKWQPSPEEAERRRERWERRGERVWSSLAEVGVKPPKPWRLRGVGKAEQGDIPVWKGGGRSRSENSKDVKQATTIRRGLVASRAGATTTASDVAGAGRSISSRIL